MELEKRQRSKEQQQSRSYSLNPLRALGRIRKYSQEVGTISMDNMYEWARKSSLKLSENRALLNFQASGGGNGTIDVYLKWRYTYLPASAKPRTAPQVCPFST